MYSTERMLDMYPGYVRAASFCSGGAGTRTAPPTQNCPHSLPPQCQSHLWPSVRRAGPNGWPSTLQPRPGAAHSRPEVRTARPPRPDTTAARLRALSSARTDSGWTRTAGPAETRRLAAVGKRPPAAKASRPAQDITSNPPGKQPRAPDGTSLRSGLSWRLLTGQKHNGPLYTVQQRLHRHPLRRTPGAAALYITPVVPLALSGLSR